MHKKDRIREITHSLYIRLVLVILFSTLVGGMIYIVTRSLSNYYINNVYISSENKELREKGYISSLQSYVNANNISSNDTDVIARWAKNNRYVYLLIYKNNELFFSSDMLPEQNEKPGGDGTTQGGEGTEDNTQEDSQKPSGTPDDIYGSGITVNYPTREELKKYAEENDLYELELSDGMLFASVAEFTEYFYYDVANIFSLFIAMVIMAVILIYYFSSIISRVKRLDRNVMVVAGGDINSPIPSDGYDEIARLSTNVENMRCAILESIQEEREARRANTELITAMSHDIRTPLTVLLGYLEIMKNEAKDENMLAYVEASENTAMRLKALSDDMFNYFLAFGSTKENFTLEKYDVKTLFDQMLAEHIIILREKDFNVDFQLEGEGFTDGSTVLTDAPKLMRIVDNLFSNLSKYADPTQPIAVKVSGDGKRISLEIKNKIKNPSNMTESNGVGLKTCQRLASFVADSFEYGKDDDEFYAKLSLVVLPPERE